VTNGLRPKLETKPEQEADFLPRLGRHLAHELNNPISAISSAAFLIQDFIEAAEGGKVEVENVKPFVESIGEECKKLKEIVEEFSKYVTTDSVLAMPIEINEFVRMRVAELSKNGEPVTFQDSKYPIRVIADTGALQFVLRALVTYAVQSGATSVTVSVSNGAQCAITIQDNRPESLTMEEREEVFSPLPKHRMPGLGLKLPLVKKLIDLHHGLIEFMEQDGMEERLDRMERGSGVSICISLPLATVSE
jgi:signal transduction histidine kinase